MRSCKPRLSLWALALVTVAGSNLSLVSPVIGMSSAPETRNHTEELIDQGEVAEAEKNYPMAFDRYAQAYRSIDEAQRAVEGTEAIDYALRVSKKLLALDVNNMAILQSQADLFREHLEDLGSPQARKDVADQLAKLDAKITDLEYAHVTPVPAPTPEPIGPTSSPAPIGPTSSPAPTVAPPRSTRAEGLGDDQSSQGPLDKRDVVYLSVGATSLVGGIAMIAGGGWVFGETTRRANASVAEIQAEIIEAQSRPRTDEQTQSDSAAIAQFTEDLGVFRRQSRARGTALVVVGSVLAAAGIGLSTWTLVKIRGGRKRTGHRTTLSPAFARRQLGLHFSVSF